MLGFKPFKPYYDPEQVVYIHIMWWSLHCLITMRKGKVTCSATEQQRIDAGYCLDRYSSVDYVYKK